MLLYRVARSCSTERHFDGLRDDRGDRRTACDVSSFPSATYPALLPGRRRTSTRSSWAHHYHHHARLLCDCQRRSTTIFVVFVLAFVATDHRICIIYASYLDSLFYSFSSHDSFLTLDLVSLRCTMLSPLFDLISFYHILRSQYSSTEWL